MSSTATSDRRRLFSLYVGGLMGPFGTIVIIPMFPELRETFDASSAAVGWGFTIYLLPFALMLLVSGTIGERVGRRRTVRFTYLAYAAASIVCALAPTLGVFLLGRALQGIANAFITPLLVAGLAEMVPAVRFGRAVGVYSSFQAAGGGLAPVIGGVLADVDWRWAFVGVAVVAAVLASAPPDGEPRLDTDPPDFRPLLERRMLIFGFGVLAAAAGPIGVSVLVGVAARDELGLSGTSAGLLLLVGPLAAMVLGPIWGRLVDRIGFRHAGLAATTGVTIATATLVFATSVARLTILSAVVTALTGLVVVVIQGLSSTILPDNRGGTLSFVLAFRFLGHGIGPIALIPIFERTPTVAFALAAALGIITIAAFEVTTADRATPTPGLLSRRRRQE